MFVRKSHMNKETTLPSSKLKCGEAAVRYAVIEVSELIDCRRYKYRVDAKDSELDISIA